MMHKEKKTKEELIEKINAAGRKMSTATAMFHQAVAENAGMSGTDHKYLDLLIQEGAMTAGKLAQLTGLTTGAVTGIIDRLEKQGLVNRKNDSHDRRIVFVVPKVEIAMKRLAPLFDSLHTGLITFYDKFSDQELEAILRFLLDTTEFFQRKTQQLRRGKS